MAAPKLKAVPPAPPPEDDINYVSIHLAFDDAQQRFGLEIDGARRDPKARRLLAAVLRRVTAILEDPTIPSDQFITEG